MPERKGASKFDSDCVQGDGSYVMIHARTVGEILGDMRERESRDNLWYRLGRWIAKMLDALLPFKRRVSDYEIQRDLVYQVLSYVVDWNWVDGHGKPLAKPQEDRSVAEQITNDEFAFLMECVYGSVQSANQKNSSTG